MNPEDTAIQLGYSATESGEVISRYGKKLKSYPDKDGYMHFAVSHVVKGNRADRNCSVHRLVYRVFKGEIPNGGVIHHKDGDKSNNNINNLELMSRFDHNSMHSKNKRGKNNGNFGHHWSKKQREETHNYRSDIDRMAMRIMRKDKGLSYTKLAELFSCSPKTAWRICNGKG